LLKNVPLGLTWRHVQKPAPSMVVESISVVTDVIIAQQESQSGMRDQSLFQGKAVGA
jgi:hypothetical protein